MSTPCRHLRALKLTAKMFSLLDVIDEEEEDGDEIDWTDSGVAIWDNHRLWAIVTKLNSSGNSLRRWEERKKDVRSLVRSLKSFKKIWPLILVNELNRITCIDWSKEKILISLLINSVRRASCISPAQLSSPLILPKDGRTRPRHDKSSANLRKSSREMKSPSSLIRKKQRRHV